MPDWLFVLILIVGGLILFVACAAIFAYVYVRTFFHRREFTSLVPKSQIKKLMADYDDYDIRNRSDIEKINELPFERISVRTRDGLKLVGFLYTPEKQSENTIICFHGYSAYGHKDFSAQLPFMLSLGLNVLLVNLRGHGESEGNDIGFGVLDRYDTALWVNKINEIHPRGSIFLYGVSMGAATVMMSSDLPMPLTVRGIIADCGFTSAKEVITHLVADVMHLPARPTVNIISYFTHKRIGYRLDDADARVSLSKTRIPVLFIHGGQDTFVPVSMSKQNYDACRAEKHLLIIHDATHASSYYRDQPEYEEHLKSFIYHHI